MQDGFGRKIDYLRISVTDRCNFRCQYCMSEKMTFMPKSELLSLEEITLIAERFISHGIRKIRLTGGEPLVRRDMKDVIQRLGRKVKSGELEELTLTTNGSLLTEYADHLADHAVRRINVSMDTLDPDRFSEITRGAKVETVVDGIAAAKAAGITVKINMVALRNFNEADLLPMAEFCAANGHDLTIIETMPLGDVGADRTLAHISAEEFLAPLNDQYTLKPIPHRSSGPARYVSVEPLDLRLGMITPLSNNFCDDCNRLRLTTDGKIFMCLGHNAHVDLRAAIRKDGITAVDQLLQQALKLKPLRHDFNAQLNGSAEILERHMNVTGG
ncbi:GTP 3',8-cyclase MoaA [Parasphingorhabdus sp.]|jgi:cyclic pyranopterin phosphate synthase|uniref:GTP 3',8-cyclase MoaA n=1 Tax=Parasphingorhabdus sp. TaxID=2709688 RepID=UPI0007F3B03E|nr:cyclic pyranopterin phosphate synthase MoaA [Sphingomonadales bacterium EhC05]